MARWVRFWRWTALSAALGFADPLYVCLHCFVFKGQLSSVEFFFWPFSIIFMGLDGPTAAPWSTVIAVYLYALFENVALYAAVGAALWLCVRGMRLILHHRQAYPR